MIVGHKPNGYTSTFDGHGNKVEGETRQCVHCQSMWEYRPGSGTIRGFCLRCNGFLCAQQSCMRQQTEWIDAYYNLTGKRVSCIPFEDWNNRIRDRVAKMLPLEPGWTINEFGLVVPERLG